jgi:hypothetical protein
MYHRSGIIAFAALSTFLLSGTTSPTSCPSGSAPGPSNGEVVGAMVGAGAVIAVGTIVLVKVHNSHHTLQGCVTAGPEGIQMQSKGDHKIYTLTGLSAGVKVGDVVKVHGDKKKHHQKGTGDEEFVVQKINKDYGPCQASPVAQAGVPAVR